MEKDIEKDYPRPWPFFTRELRPFLQLGHIDPLSEKKLGKEFSRVNEFVRERDRERRKKWTQLSLVLFCLYYSASCKHSIVDNLNVRSGQGD